MKTPEDRLNAAAESGDVFEILAALSEGAEINAIKNADGHGGWSALHTACWNSRATAAETLLEKGADPNARVSPVVNENSVVTPLDAAIYSGTVDRERMVAALVSYGAKASQEQLAFAAMKGKLQLVKLLVAGGAKPNVRTKDGDLVETLPDDPDTQAEIRVLRIDADRKAAAQKMRGAESTLEM